MSNREFVLPDTFDGASGLAERTVRRLIGVPDEMPRQTDGATRRERVFRIGDEDTLRKLIYGNHIS